MTEHVGLEARRPPAPALPNVMAASRRLAEGWAEVNGAVWSYGQSAMRNGVEAVEEMRHCQTLADIVAAQMQCARRNYEEGLEQAQHISRLLARISAETAESLSPNAGKG